MKLHKDTARTNEQARAGSPLTADQARGFIASMERSKTSKPARRRFCEVAQTHGNMTDDARRVYRDYGASL